MFGNITDSIEWIINNKSDPPEWMHHNSELQDNDGNTCAMTWIQNCKSDPPEWMHHNPELQNNKGNTCAMQWIEYCKTNPPEWMTQSRKRKLILDENEQKKRHIEY